MLLVMPSDTTKPRRNQVKGAFMSVLVVWLAGLLSCMPTLDAAVSRGQARLVRACGLEAAPHSVRWVHGYIDDCAGVRAAIGCARGPARDIEISDRTDPDLLDQVVTHELLHLLGAGHVPAGHGIMAASASAAVNRISAEDLAGVGCLQVRAE